ncbi:hypothetical protein [Sandaracinus amylolyticus]|uniref:hypothetical protein n=1 Tax=Sandaracinus amylolyticus TaxID=927083 RepID=UPI002E32A9BC|nr:hypothetical protein [Sandaracinus amylolyticus]
MDRNTVRSQHRPRSRWERHGTIAGAPSRHRVVIGATEFTELADGLDELRRSSSADRERRISLSDRFVGSCTNVRRDGLATTRTEERDATGSDFDPRVALLALHLLCDRASHFVWAPAARDARERAELELDRVGPLFVVRIEEHRRTTRLQHATSDLPWARLHSGPILRLSHEPGEHWIGNRVGALLHDRIARTKLDDG